MMLVCLEILWEKNGVITVTHTLSSHLDAGGDLSTGCYGDGKAGIERANNQMGAADGYRLGQIGRCSNQFPRTFSALESLSAGVTTDCKSKTLAQAVGCI